MRQDGGRGRAMPRMLHQNIIIKGSAGIIYTIVIMSLRRSTNRWWAERYNVNNAWNFNGNNGNLNNNNVNNGYQVGAVTNLSVKVETQMGLPEEDGFINLYRIMKRTRKNKRRGRDSVEFESNWVPLLIRAMNERDDKTLRIRHNYSFLTPRPRWREIFATEFGGRMIDHEICEVVMPEAEKVLSPYTYNNRRRKGSQAAINQLMEHIYEVTEGYARPARIVKIDFSGYFPNAVWSIAEGFIDDIIDKTSLDEESKSYLKWLTMISINCNPAAHCELRTASHLWKEHIDPEKSIRTKPTGVGAAIGRLIWQTAMGLYINDEIIWLTEECGIKLVCFVDDIVFVIPEEQHGCLLSLLPELRLRLAKKGVKLNERKFYDQPAIYGCEFLGSHIRPNRIHLNNCTFENAVYTIEKLNSSRYKDIDKLVSVFNSYSGLLKNRTDYKRLLELKDKLSPEWWKWLDWDKNRQCVTFKHEYSPNARLNKKYNLKLKKNEQTRNSRTNQLTQHRENGPGITAQKRRLQGHQVR